MFLKGKKQFWEIQFDIFDFKFSRFTSSFGFSRENGIGLQLYSFQIVLWSGVILSQSSEFCCCMANECFFSWSVHDQYSLCGLPKVVRFLKGSRSLLWCVVFCNMVWLLSGLPSGFWELDVALVVRVNQYKLFLCISLSLQLL